MALYSFNLPDTIISTVLEEVPKMFFAVHVYLPESFILVLLFRRVQQPCCLNLFGSDFPSSLSQLMFGSGDPGGLLHTTSVLSSSRM